MALSSGETLHPVESRHSGFSGIRIRDWMATMAMQALIGSDPQRDPVALAETAYRLADEMLAKRDRDQASGLEQRWRREIV